MPVVPRYDQPRVATEALPGARVSTATPTAAFGVPGAPDLTGVQRVIAKAVEEERAKADQVALLSADNQLAKLATDLRVQVLNRRGRDALGATEEMNEAWEKGVSQIESSLQGDRQRIAFRARAQGRYQSLYAAAEEHAASEMRSLDDQETKTAVANRLSDAIENYSDPEAVSQAAAETRAILADYAKRNGMGEEAQKAATETAISSLHSGVVSQMLADGQDLAAKQYVADHREELRGEDLTRVDAALREGSVRGESQREADRIMGLGLTRGDALEEARKITDPDVRDMTVQRINQRFQEMKAAEREEREAALTQATNIIERTKSVDSVPPALWTTFSPSERAGLRSYARQLAKGEPVETDWTTYYDLKTLASSPATRDKFLETNLLTYRAKLGDTEFKELVGLQASVRAGDARAADHQLAGFRTTKQVVDDNLAAAGIDPTPKPGSGDAERVAQFRRLVDERVAEIQARTGKKATPEDVQGVVDNLLVQGVVSGSGIFGLFRKERRAFEAEPGETLEIAPEDIPQVERGLIEAALRKRGIPVTDERVLQLYQQRLKQITGTAPPPEFSTGGGSTF